MLGRHPEICVRLDMYEYAEQDYGSVLEGAHSTITSYLPADVDIDDMLIIFALKQEKLHNLLGFCLLYMVRQLCSISSLLQYIIYILIGI